MSPRIAVVGTGAQGAGIGADLVRAGLDVTFVEQWPDHVEAMKANGITVVMPQETVTTPVRAIHLCEVATLKVRFDLVFVVMKAYDTRWAVELIKPYLQPDGMVVGLQNGMSLDDIADIVGPERTLGAVIEMASNMWVPGSTNRQNPPSEAWFALGGIHPAAQARAEDVAAVLRHAGTVEVTRDIRSAKWMKLVVNAGELVPTAILDMAMRDAAAVPEVHRFMLRCAREAVRTAVAAGNAMVPIFGLEDMDLSDPDRFVEQLLDAVLQVFSKDDTQTTVLQDWIKGRHCEVDEINGLVVDEATKLGGSAPANELTVELAHRIERGELTARPENAALFADLPDEETAA